MDQLPATPVALDPDPGIDSEDSEPGGASGPIIAIIVATLVLSYARDIFMPLAMASLLAVIFTPIAVRLERFLGRFLSAALVVVATVAVFAGIGYFLTTQLTSVAVQMTDYSDNIAAKLTALKGSTPDWLQRIETGVKDVEEQVQGPAARTKNPAPTVVQAFDTQSGIDQVLKPTLPILSGLFEGLIVIVLFFFLLYSRRDLRDRLVRLAARGRITIAAEAIETAGAAVGHYLLLFALLNLAYGIAIGLAIWWLGLPNPALWGAVAALLRFIPYVGVPVATLLPTLVAFAVFPGWSKSIEVLAVFVGFDQVASYFIEPFVIGHGIGLSPLALLVSAMFWAWLWGLPGLLLATSLTACLKVAGDYIPALGFFSVLLGADRPLDGYHDYYRSLLELDEPAARKIVTNYCDEHGLEPAFDDVLIPAIDLAGAERAEDHISEQNLRTVIDTTVRLVSELGNRFARPRLPYRLRILGVCAPGEVHRLGLQILLELLRRTGAAANFLDENKSPAEIREFVKTYAPDMLLMTCTMPECLPAALELVRELKLDAPRLTIIGGGPAAISAPSELLAAGFSQICASRNDVRRGLRLYALQRAISRSTKIPARTAAARDAVVNPPPDPAPPPPPAGR